MFKKNNLITINSLIIKKIKMENAKREFYENGNVKEEYQIDESGERYIYSKVI